MQGEGKDVRNSPNILVEIAYRVGSENDRQPFRIHLVENIGETILFGIYDTIMAQNKLIEWL